MVKTPMIIWLKMLEITVNCIFQMFVNYVPGQTGNSTCADARDNEYIFGETSASGLLETALSVY